MDLNTDSGMLSSHTAFEEPLLEQETSLSGSHSQTGHGGTILLQLLEFKTHLHEVVEELHIRRDGETRFEDQISQLVLEKQELEWEKEALQHQIETMTNQHSESLTSVKKQFQVKLQLAEEEKGKYQVSGELKDKEINNLKEELKSLQLLKFNLEKKSSELEQKLALQNRTKDTHLNQLGEVEKRFAALSRQCAMVREAHRKLEQNVDEAMKMNTKLSCANKRREEMIVALKKELDEVSKKLIKEKMKAVVNEKSLSSAGREQHLQELQQKLKMESEMNKKLRKENVSERFEKQELMRSLQQNQKLLLNQTRTVRRQEQELQTQRRMFQALKEEQEVMREKSKAMEDELVQLTESYAASRTSWDKEKVKFLDQLRSEQEQLRAANDARRDLGENPVELSVGAGSEFQLAAEQENVSTDRSSLMVEDIRCKETLNDHISISDPSDPGSLQISDASQGKSSEPLQDSGEGQNLSNHQQPQINQHALNNPNTFTCGSNNPSSLPDYSGAETEMKLPEKTSEMSELIMSVGHQGASNPKCAFLDGFASFLTRNPDEEWNTGMNEQGISDKRQQENYRELQETDAEQEDKKDAKDGCHAEETRTLTADGIDVLQDTEGSAKATGETSNTGTELIDKGEGEVTDGVKEKEQTAESSAETQIPALTTADTAEKSVTLQVSDFTNTDPPRTDSDSSDSAENLCQKITEDDSNKYKFDMKEVCNSEVVQSNFTDEVRTLCPDSEPPNDQSGPAVQNQKHKKQSGETAGDLPSECFENLLQAAPSQENKVQVGEANETQNKTDNLLHIDPSLKEGDEKFDACVSEECVLVTKPKTPSQEVQESVQLSSVAADEDDASNRQESELNMNTSENDTGESAPLSETSGLKGEAGETNTQECVKTDGNKTDLKQSVQPGHKNFQSSEAGGSKRLKQPLKQVKPASSESTLISKKTSTSLFEWGAAQRRTFSSRDNSDFSVLHKLTQETQVSGPGTLGRPLSLTSTSIKNKHNKVPLVVSRASDLFSSSSVSGAAAYLKNQQQEEKMKETCRETAANTDWRPPLFISSFPVSSQGSRQTSSECSRAPSPAAGSGSESNLGPSCSQEREDQQSSFRAQISKIEQFLNAERLRLPKRPRIDN